MRRYASATAVVAMLASAALVFPRNDVARATPAKPNIVLIVTDDQPFDSVAKAMPFLTSKPGGHWIDFSNAFDQTPLCCPSRASILSGLYPHHHGVEENTGGGFDPTSTIATWLDDAGYRTGLAGKYFNDYPFDDPLTPPAGWDDWFADVGPHRYYDYTMNDNGTLVSYGSGEQNYHTDVIANRADAFIRASAGEPFFFYAAPIAPHAPLAPPPRYSKTPFSVTRPPNFNEADVSDKPAWIQATNPIGANGEKGLDKERVQVYRMVRAVDDMVQKVFQALTETGTLDETIIVVMTDNGYLRGEHRQLGKGCVYEECIRSPMFVRVPWLDSRTETKIVANVDVAPTLAEMAGTLPATPVDGFSFAPLLEDPGMTWRDALLLEYQSGDGNRPKFWGVRTAGWKYVELETGEKELYDLVADPYELSNRANDPALADVQAGLAAELAVLKAAPPHEAGHQVSIADASATEGDVPTAASFTVTLSPAATDTVTVSYGTADGTAAAGEDYEARSGAVTFDPGETSKTIEVPILGDDVAEPDESFTVALSGPSGAFLGDGTATGSIADDDAPPSVSIADVTVAEGDAGTTAAQFTISLSSPVAGSVAVSWSTADGTAVSPADFTSASGVETFDPGQTVRTVSVQVNGDTSLESDETFTIDIASGDAPVSDPQATGTITNDDAAPPPPALSISDVSVIEGTGGSPAAVFTVTLSASSAQTVTVSYETVNGTAKAPGDFGAATGLLQFAPGETVETIEVVIVGDSLDERTENFTVTLSGASGATIADASGRCAIQDDD